MMAQTLVGRVLALGQSLSHEPAVLFRKETLNYTDLKERIMRCAAFLSRLGVGRGDRVLFTALSRPETVVIYLGIQYIGAIAVFMDKNSTAEDGRQIYDETQASLYVTDRPIGEDPSGRMRIFSLKELYTACAKTETGSSGIPAYRYPEEEDIAEVLFTTGTTGRPKGVMLSYRAVYQISKNTTNGIGILPTDRILIPLPLNHSLALRELRSALWMGAAVVLQNGFTFAKDVERNIKELGCTGMVTVPASLELIRGQMQNRFSEIVGSLRYIEVGAGSLSVRQRREFSTLLPDTRLNNTWGSSETGGALFMDMNEVILL